MSTSTASPKPISTSPPSDGPDPISWSPTSTSSAFSVRTERPARSASSPTPPSPRSNNASSGSKRSVPAPGRPPLLCPPATIISPPSPVEPTTGRLPSLPFAADSPPSLSPSGEEDERSWSTPPPKPSRMDSSETSPRPMAATRLSLPPRFMSPSSSTSPLPGSPGLDGSASPNGNRRDSLAVPSPPAFSPGSDASDQPFFSSSPFASPGIEKRGSFPPTPSSPHHYPKRMGHRRESSTHRVKETQNGQQRSTEDGETMVNQYRIGKGLGKGGFAKVELAVDVGTGKEYAIKEFSQSRLHTQSLQEKQRQASRGRMRGRGRGRGAPGRGGGPGGERRCSMSPSEDEDEDDLQKDGGVKAVTKKGVRRDRAVSEPDEGDPLGLIRREIAVMKKLDHPNIVHLYEAISVPMSDALFLVLEYLPGGVLMKVHMGEEESPGPPFSVDQSREYFRQLILGLEYLHANGVIHRDIKPDNILLSEDRSTVKLCDFGVSEMFVVENSDDRIKKSGGSPAFLSPESFTSHTHEVHGKLVDIWALGVTLYCMFTGSLPFNTENPIELFEMVQNEDPNIPEHWNPDQKDLVLQMLRKEPTFRIHMFMIREHPWVTEDGANPMISRDDNLYHVGKFVEEPTPEELSSAIGALRGVFTVIRAVQKMRRLQLARRSLTSSPQPSPPVRNSTLDSVTSTAISGTSGSTDSYISEIPTEDTSIGEYRGADPAVKGDEDDNLIRVDSPGGIDGDKEDGEVPPLTLDEGKLKLPAVGDRPSSPKQLLGQDAPWGESTKTAAEHMGALRISTGAKADQDGSAADDVQMVDSPSDEADNTPQQSQPKPDGGAGEVQMVDSPVDGDEDGDEEVQIMDSPVADEEVQTFESPVDQEEDVPAVRHIKGRPRPRP